MEIKNKQYTTVNNVSDNKPFICLAFVFEYVVYPMDEDIQLLTYTARKGLNFKYK